MDNFVGDFLGDVEGTYTVILIQLCSTSSVC